MILVPNHELRINVLVYFVIKSFLYIKVFYKEQIPIYSAVKMSRDNKVVGTHQVGFSSIVKYCFETNFCMNKCCKCSVRGKRN